MIGGVKLNFKKLLVYALTTMVIVAPLTVEADSGYISNTNRVVIITEKANIKAWLMF